MHRRVNSSPRHPGATSPAGARACGDRRTIGGLPALAQDPRVGLIGATAFAGSIGDIRSFRSPRRFAAWLGLTPREFSSGNIRRLGSISKRGDGYLRMLLVHGARAVLYSANAAQRAGRPLDALREWGLRVSSRSGHNKAAVAVANKLARIIWASWYRQRDFEFRPPSPATH
ncbi:MAG: IS110 family transposase [Gammaproteobacteria bacterium]|nr:MAG: IS110 family transposase [Gammaproteobacteria bacterium]